ncbi:MAG: D-alanyl-D-alanine carboxypeptidase [Treponema sp.]|nr:D-alanyl-D-alanine carboxypeptidase [Treponema sp.]
MKNSQTSKAAKISVKNIFALFFAVLIFAFFLSSAIRLYNFKKAEPPLPLSKDEEIELNNLLDEKYFERKNILKSLPYKTSPVTLNLNARSAILIDVSNGCILFEKAADEIIPPASLTKIAAMYVVMQKIQKGEVSLNDIVPLPKECWARNMPPHSSLMFLGKNQIVTLEELLCGLDVCSGNDAAYAIAYYVAGGMEAFVSLMNEVVQSLGLLNTKFFEVSGYSELNQTTAREMASLCRIYLKQFPETLEKFHSLKSFTYPKEHNLAPEDRNKVRTQDFSNGLPENITMGITQQNTNVLLGRLSGTDGLKTGYIEESGYNLSLTAKRFGTRFLSVTMGGPGANLVEGNRYRAQDGTNLIEWAFASFASCTRTEAVHKYFIPVTGAKKQWIYLTPAFDFESLTVPFLQGSSPEDAALQVKVGVNLPKYIEGEIQKGCEYGTITYSLGEIVLQEIPLVADRTLQKANFFVSASDFIARLILKSRTM